ncbi:hypothetical protein HU200_052381 [Digitaria exilis]|uniref:DNL-type domain-containing protein n=1 Tax=Digitaria exilis TaxID=1010633 RepID=A0A835ANW5_9POAL|nr:hypothetical protein HU200_052381 [Digitaria exilis]CAB3486782.1 unnamed protein product [Digitaria exilis]
MATTAAAYGCFSAALVLPFAAFRGDFTTAGHPTLPAPSSSPPRSPGRRVTGALLSSFPSSLRGSLVSKLVFLSSRRLRVSCLRRRLVVSACSSGQASLEAAASPTEATFDIKLPRRSLLVQFTCNACGERTQRLINRVAYERETVFLQCAGCQVYHKFVDNPGLVVEYDLREENALQEENLLQEENVVSTDSED